MLGVTPSLLAVQCNFHCLFDSALKIVSSWLIYYSLFLLALQMYKTLFSSAAKLPLCHNSTLSISLFLFLVMATVFSRVVVALQHTACSHCPAVTRAHISTGRLAVLYWKSHCYATYVILPAAPSVCLFISLHFFFTCLLASSELVLGHLTVLSGVVKEASALFKRPAPVWYKGNFMSHLWV